MRSKIIHLAAASLLAFGASAQVPDLGIPGMSKVVVEARFEPGTARAGELVTLIATVTIAPGHHIYGRLEETGPPTKLTIDEPGGLELFGAAEIPIGDKHVYPGFVSYWLVDEVELKQRLVVPAGTQPGEVEVAGVVDYMVCTEQLCDPAAEEGVDAVLVVEAGEARAEYLPPASGPGSGGEVGGRGIPGESTTSDPPVAPLNNDLKTMPLWLFLLAAVGGGLFALAMPCTYPMIPITISFFTKQADVRGGKVLPLALAYGAGIVAIFVVIGVAVGEPIAQFAANPWLNLGIGLLFLFFALVLFGLINLQPPAFLMRAASKASTQGGLLGVFLMGMTLVLTSFTCTAPVVGSLLALGGEGGDVGRLVLGMAVFGTTMAVPFIFLSLVPGKLQAMPRSGEWMNTLKVFLGFVEVAAALKFISNADLFWRWEWLSRELFLYLWAGIMLAAGMFLLGLIRLKGETAEIGPGRMVSALAVVMFGIYCAYGAAGNRLDWVMSAIAPNYSNRVIAAGSAEAAPRTHDIVVDDYDGARKLALAQNKKVLLNFTGIT